MKYFFIEPLTYMLFVWSQAGPTREGAPQHPGVHTPEQADPAAGRPTPHHQLLYSKCPHYHHNNNSIFIMPLKLCSSQCWLQGVCLRGYAFLNVCVCVCVCVCHVVSRPLPAALWEVRTVGTELCQTGTPLSGWETVRQVHTHTHTHTHRS